jgi:hypothetical protein
MNDEARLQEAAKRLGANAAERLDVAATARAVVERLRSGDEPARQSPIWVQPAWLRIAAALVIVVGGAAALRQAWPDRAATNHATHFVADDLNDLSTDQLRDVLGQFEQMIDSATVPDTGTDLRELDAQQLRTMLRSLEG